MLSKLTTVQMVLILGAILIVGLVLGNVLPPFRHWFKRNGNQTTAEPEPARITNTPMSRTANVNVQERERTCVQECIGRGFDIEYCRRTCRPVAQ